MTNEINGRTPNEIKKGLECCQLHDGYMHTDCSHCPYYLVSAQCDFDMHKDALAYIEHLERERDAAQAELVQIKLKHGDEEGIVSAAYLFQKAEQEVRAYMRRQQEATAPKWISVEERLPEPDEKVLICARSNKTNVHTIAMTSYTLHKYGFNIEGWNEPWQYFNYDWVITHWMPLPSTEGLNDT